jgi:hypothetical protein
MSPTPAQAGVFTWKIETDDRPTDRRQRPRQNHPRRSRRPHRRAEGQWREPGLSIILVGEDPASQVYTKHKVNDSTETGLRPRWRPTPPT